MNIRSGSKVVAILLAVCILIVDANVSWGETSTVELMTPQEVQNYVRDIGGGQILVVTPAAPIATPCMEEMAGEAAAKTNNRTLSAISPCGDGKECKLKWIKKGVATCEMKGEPPCGTGDCSLCRCTKDFGITKQSKTFCACIPGGDCSKANDFIGDLFGFECKKLEFPTPTPTPTPSPTPTPKPPNY